MRPPCPADHRILYSVSRLIEVGKHFNHTRHCGSFLCPRWMLRVFIMSVWMKPAGAQNSHQSSSTLQWKSEQPHITIEYQCHFKIRAFYVARLPTIVINMNQNYISLYFWLEHTTKCLFNSAFILCNFWVYGKNSMSMNAWMQRPAKRDRKYGWQMGMHICNNTIRVGRLMKPCI